MFTYQKNLLHALQQRLHDLMFWFQRRHNRRMYWAANSRYFADLLSQPDGPMTDDYCWEHYPGGWTCPLCQESTVQ